MKNYGLLALAGLLISHWAGADDYKVPRTAEGAPDLQGVWTNVSLTTLLRSQQFKTNVVSREVAEQLAHQRAAQMEKSLAPTDPNSGAPPAGGNVGGYNSFFGDSGDRLARVKGEYRTTWLIDPADGKLPYSPRGEQIFQQAQAIQRENFDGPEVRPMAERCIIGFGSTGGPPMINVLYNNQYQIVQTQDRVVILVEMNHDARVIRVGGKHLPSQIRPWLGDSVGRWEGVTLVVETTNFNPGESLRLNYTQSFYVSTQGKVTERFKRMAKNEILYEFTVEDPDIYAKPWRAQMVLSATTGKVFEYACHEGNYALPGILAGARKSEADAAGQRP
jgi:hypothetical protein